MNARHPSPRHQCDMDWRLGRIGVPTFALVLSEGAFALISWILQQRHFGQNVRFRGCPQAHHVHLICRLSVNIIQVYKG